MQSNPYLEEGKGYDSMNRLESPYPSSNSTLMNQNQNPTVWEKVKKTFGLGGKRRLKTLKIKKMGKSRKSRRKLVKRRLSKKSKRRSFRKLGGTTNKVWIAQGKTPNGYYGGSTVVNPYSPPMDFAPVKDIPTAQPHNMVG